MYYTPSYNIYIHVLLIIYRSVCTIPVILSPVHTLYPLHQVGRRIEEDSLIKRQAEIESHFAAYPDGIPVENFVHMTKRMCGIPSFFNLPLCKRINDIYNIDSNKNNSSSCANEKSRNNNNNHNLSMNNNDSNTRQPYGINVKLLTFLKFWELEIEPYDRIERFFRAIKQPSAECIYKDDFVPYLQELLHFHPGLDFLENHDDFQRKYALTVITRIFYQVRGNSVVLVVIVGAVLIVVVSAVGVIVSVVA